MNASDLTTVTESSHREPNINDEILMNSTAPESSAGHSTTRRTTNVISITSLDALLSDPLAMSTVFEHCAHYPPHGPFAYLTAVSLAQVLLQRHSIEVSPSLLVTVFSTFFKTDHLREWPSLYVAAELRLTDVENL